MTIFFVLFPGGARAFDGWEHEGLGNISLEANLTALQNSINSPPAGMDTNKASIALTILKQFKEGINRGTQNPLAGGTVSNKAPTITYGTIVKLVDYMRDEYDLLHDEDTGSGWPTAATNTDIFHLEELGSSVASLYGASHINQNHFQGRVFYMFWFWHQQAVKAASDGNLWGGLLLNAYGDHFLQDSFAPGHIIAPRDEGSQDVYALIIHDSYNRKGMNYVVRNPQDCQAALQMLLPVASKPEWAIIALDKVTLQTSAINGLLTEKGQLVVTNYGDDLINQSPREVALVSAYCAQSIHDVVASYLESKEVDSFKNYRWTQHFGGSTMEGQIEMIDIWQSFGDLVCEERGINDPEIVVPDGTGGAIKVPLAAVKSDVVSSLAMAAEKNPAFGINLGLQDISKSSGSHAQTLVEAETMIAGGRWDYLRKDYSSLRWLRWPSQAGLEVGYSGLFDPNTMANGMVGHLIFPVPQLNLQFSLYGGERYYSRGSYGAFGDFEGVRAEWGLNMGNLFFGVGHDHFAEENHRLTDGVSIQGGISFEFPWSRTPKFLHLRNE